MPILVEIVGWGIPHAKMIGGGRPLVPEILDQSDRVFAKSSIFARSASAVTPV